MAKSAIIEHPHHLTLPPDATAGYASCRICSLRCSFGARRRTAICTACGQPRPIASITSTYRPPDRWAHVCRPCNGKGPQRNLAPAFRITFAFGHRRKDGRPLDQQSLHVAEEHLKRLLARVCGGASALQQAGAYSEERGRVATEASTLIWALHPARKAPPSDLLYAEASAVAAFLDQDCLLLAIEQIEAVVQFPKPASRLLQRDLDELPLTA